MIQEFLQKHDGQSLKPLIKCTDGFRMSVQASAGHYCTPRKPVGPYTHVEVGYPSAVDEDLLPYAVDSEYHIFAQVPIEVVDRIIERHGGMVVKRRPRRR